MNVLLRDTEEFIDGKNTGTLGLVLIRCVPVCSFLFADIAVLARALPLPWLSMPGLLPQEHTC